MATWHLDYQVAAFGAYAAILVEAVNLIFGGIDNTSPLTISVLTNGSAIIFAGFGPSNAVPLAAIRIGLTTLILLCNIALRSEKAAFDGTYAILCSCAHLVFQFRITSTGDRCNEDDGDDLHQRESEKRSHESNTHHRMDYEASDETMAMSFKRHLVFQFEDVFRLDGSMAFIAVSGTALTYRVFDFDTGFGLVFASFSALLCTTVVLLINSARYRGRLLDTEKALQKLVGIMIPLAIFWFMVCRDKNVQNLLDDVRWWKQTFGFTWFLWLFSMIYTPSRFLVHATLFPCAACRQADLDHSLATNLDPCPWEECASLPKLTSSEIDEEGRTVVLIKRRKGPDLVDRYWLNDQAWFQISPRTFVIVFVLGLCFALIGAYIPPHLAKNTDVWIAAATFYIIMVFTFTATGHTPVEHSPEMMGVPLKDSVPQWRAIIQALLATISVHFLLVFVLSYTHSPLHTLEFLVSGACAGLMPHLLAGVSRVKDESGLLQEKKACNVELREPSRNRKPESISSIEEATTVETRSGMVTTGLWSRIDLRVSLMGGAAAIINFAYNKDGNSFTALLALLTTSLLVFLEAYMPIHRDIEPIVLCTTSVALVGIVTHSNDFSLFGIYTNRIGDDAQPSPIYVSLWYATICQMIMVNRRLLDQEHPAERKIERNDHLLFSYRIGNFEWQLRNSRVAICLVLASMSTFCGESWPIPINSTVTSLILYVIIVGFRRTTTGDADKEDCSNTHVAVIALCAMTTATIVFLNRRGMVDFGDDWTVGARTAILTYSLLLTGMRVLEKYKRSRAGSSEVDDAPMDETHVSGAPIANERNVSDIVSV